MFVFPEGRVFSFVNKLTHTTTSVNMYCRVKAQLYGRSRQCGRPVGALIEREFHSNPLINGLIQHTFKMNF